MRPERKSDDEEGEADEQASLQSHAQHRKVACPVGLQSNIPRRSGSTSALRSARLPANLIGSPISYANRLIGSPITSQSTGSACPAPAGARL